MARQFLTSLNLSNGQVLGGIFAPILSSDLPAGASDHAGLSNLGYAESGHTGFAGTGVANTFTDTQTIDPVVVGEGDATVLDFPLQAKGSRLVSWHHATSTSQRADVAATVGASGRMSWSVTVQDAFGGNVVSLALGTNGQVMLVSAHLTVAGQNAAKVPGQFAAASGQSVNIFEWTDDSLIPFSAVSKNGGFVPAHMADADAVNDTIYFSTDAGKLVYKDSGGVVNNLY